MAEINSKRELVCAYCKGAASKWHVVLDRNRARSKDTFAYRRCGACGLIFLSNVPADLSQYYDESYYGMPKTVIQATQLVENESPKFELFDDLVRPKSLLEIGPAFGSFAICARNRGIDVAVIERDAACCEYLSLKHGISTTCSDRPLDAIAAMGKFDVISMWQVIEHLANPWELVRELGKHLAPNGKVVVATPNPDAMQARVFGKLWTHIDAPRHLNLIRFPLMQRWFEESGMKCISVTTSDKTAQAWNQFGWTHSLLGYQAPTTLRWPILVVGKLLTLLARPLELRPLAGASYTAVFARA
jgi:2-polyprenyl-3-methyl-5-hydroxy-6-metoxy-1,4-benzoquinol methylase